MPRIGGPLESPPLHFCPYGGVFHDPGYPVLPASQTLLPEHRCDPRTPIEPSALSVDLPDATQQLLVVSLTGARPTSPPRIITTSGDLQHFTHTLGLVYLSVLFHKLILHRFCLENTAKAFFKMSRSSLTFSNSFRSRLISAFSGLTRPFPVKA